MKLKLHNLIFIGMAAGVVVGLLLWWTSRQAREAGNPEPAFVAITLWVLDLLGPTIFMGALKMIIAPLILASIVAGVTSLPDMKELGAIGWKTMVYYLLTTAIAVVIGLIAVLTIQPGRKEAAAKVRSARQEQLAEYRIQHQKQTGEPALRGDQRASP